MHVKAFTFTLFKKFWKNIPKLSDVNKFFLIKQVQLQWTPDI